jgi:hypothetical protein
VSKGTSSSLGGNGDCIGIEFLVDNEEGAEVGLFSVGNWCENLVGKCFAGNDSAHFVYDVVELTCFVDVVSPLRKSMPNDCDFRVRERDCLNLLKVKNCCKRFDLNNYELINLL